jgi:predicted transcriptional regulator
VIDATNLTELTSRIVAAYVSRNLISPQDVGELTRSVHGVLSDLRNGRTAWPERAEDARPAVPVKKSVTDDWIICLEDGKRFKSLRRHLKSAFGMTPEDYRRKWGLPPDYPMVAPSYSARRSGLAKQMGLGRPGGPDKGRRGRKPKPS